MGIKVWAGGVWEPVTVVQERGDGSMNLGSSHGCGEKWMKIRGVSAVEAAGFGDWESVAWGGEASCRELSLWVDDSVIHSKGSRGGGAKRIFTI